ncbi:Mannan endo-1,4-beta-mannosidase 5 [Camellia lanceoleosa]|uniref:Mannan endo-1,4-beta-mannosidase 5 n=1 Tax=Camellia lanceoleosa TaxID=1840588 RepID=A0ACC0GW93_9ERIC|nr:Mannan endo-1,4-beta-mannosidase 5 [Camellia lanceoleosa]
MHVAADPSGIERNKVSQVFHDAATAGLSALDFVISEAKKYGIRLIFSFVNNYKDFGGRRQYVQWAQNAESSRLILKMILNQYYKNHVKRVMTRLNTITRIAYKNDETIMVWELMNEPRCQSDYSGRTINGWVEEMVAYVKSIDNQHLLEIGMEGFYGDSMPERKQVNPGYQVGTDFISSNLIKDIDFTTIHAYPDIWLSGQNENSQMAFMQKWVENHWADSGKIVRKPLVITEFGKSNKDPGFGLSSSRDSFMNTVFTDIDNLERNGGTIGGSLE